MKITMIGTGYVGLGNDVICVDIRYRNIGHDFEKKIVEESYTSIDREKK